MYVSWVMTVPTEGRRFPPGTLVSSCSKNWPPIGVINKSIMGWPKGSNSWPPAVCNPCKINKVWNLEFYEQPNIGWCNDVQHILQELNLSDIFFNFYWNYLKIEIYIVGRDMNVSSKYGVIMSIIDNFIIRFFTLNLF